MAQSQTRNARSDDEEARSETMRKAEHVWHRVANEYDWVHTMLGIAGNLLFLVGSVLFLFESLKTLGVWLFILGATGMLVGSVGAALVRQSNT